MTLSPGATSFFSAPDQTLDPTLFDGDRLRAWVRGWVKHTALDFLRGHFRNPEKWAIVWLAGSGVSYHWSAARSPGDLDCLIGVDNVAFREANPDYTGLGDDEIAHVLNRLMQSELWPQTAAMDIGGKTFEVTFYVNPGATDIRSIKPYSAYNVTTDEWTVRPQDGAAITDVPAAWQQKAALDMETAKSLVRRYSRALSEVQNATNPAYRVNAESHLNQALEDSCDLFDEIHEGRKSAFSLTGGGYADYGNYRWQAGKASGIIPALRQLVDYRDARNSQEHLNTYGVELPDANTLITRAAMYYTNTVLD